MDESIEQKLFGLGVGNLERARLHLDVYKKASSREELDREFRERRFSCDYEQFMLPQFRELYSTDETLRRDVNSALSHFGIPEDIVHKYITEWGNQPYVLLAFEHPEIPAERRISFRDAAIRLMLNSMRNYLEIS